MSHTATFRTWPEAQGWLPRLTEWVRLNTQQGRQVTVTAKEVKRSLPQNSLIHPVIAKLSTALGRPTDTESLRKLRYLLLEQWRHEAGRQAMFERSFDGMRWVCVDKGTSDLDKPDCTEFIEWLLSTEAEITTKEA